MLTPNEIREEFELYAKLITRIERHPKYYGIDTEILDSIQAHFHALCMVMEIPSSTMGRWKIHQTGHSPIQDLIDFMDLQDAGGSK